MGTAASCREAKRSSGPHRLRDCGFLEPEFELGAARDPGAGVSIFCDTVPGLPSRSNGSP
jgi:hypothetical protein